MTEDERLALSILQSFNAAILRRIGPDKYVFFGMVPDFYNSLFPPVNGEPCSAPWETSPMLEFFLIDAEEFFDLNKIGSINSGIWTEDGLPHKNSALRAIAVNLGDAQVIIIRLLVEEYAERVTTLRKAREQLLENRQLTNNLTIFREKSRIDGLTHVFNKTTFMELLLDEIKRSQIMEYPLYLLVLDIDDFKRINDNYGHLIGDKILHGMGAALKGVLRRHDVIGRYGGEEFMVLLSHALLSEVKQIAEKIRLTLASLVVPEAPGITVSIGCTAYTPDELPDIFFKRADDALYMAKKEGKNRVCVK